MILRKRNDARSASYSSSEAIVDLMTRFESLGSACEFGLVQRICGAEPLGLFRFAASKIDNLCRVLERRLDDFLTDDDLAFEIRDLEYMTYSRVYADFHMHTLAYAGRDREPDVFARELKKATYLRKRFLSDWSQNQKTYVYCGDADEASIVRLLTILEQEAPCTLLWVVDAPSPERRGQVDVVRPRLLKGYLAHQATFHWGPRLDLPAWAQICFSADAMARTLAAPVRPPFFPRLDAEVTWSRAPCGLVDHSRMSGRCRVLRRRKQAVPVARATVSGLFVERARIVFSAWVWLSKTFEGRHLGLRSAWGDAVNFGNANPTLVETWQQVWLVLKGAGPTSPFDVTVYVDAVEGSEFFVTGAQVEDGPVPGEGQKPDGVPAWSEPVAAPESFGSRHPLRRRRRAAQRKEAARSAHELFQQGDALMRAGCFEEADIVLSAGTILWPRNAEFFSHRGLCAEMSGDPELAAERWRDLTRIHPHIAMGHHRLAAALRVSGNVADAVRIIEAALAEHSNDPAMVVEAARTYEAASRRGDALALWDRVIAAHGDCRDWLDQRERLRQTAQLAPVMPPSPAETPAGPP